MFRNFSYVLQPSILRYSHIFKQLNHLINRLTSLELVKFKNLTCNHNFQRESLKGKGQPNNWMRSLEGTNCKFSSNLAYFIILLNSPVIFILFNLFQICDKICIFCTIKDYKQNLHTQRIKYSS